MDDSRGVLNTDTANRTLRPQAVASDVPPSKMAMYLQESNLRYREKQLCEREDKLSKDEAAFKQHSMEKQRELDNKIANFQLREQELQSAQQSLIDGENHLAEEQALLTQQRQKLDDDLCSLQAKQGENNLNTKNNEQEWRSQMADLNDRQHNLNLKEAALEKQKADLQEQLTQQSQARGWLEEQHQALTQERSRLESQRTALNDARTSLQQETGHQFHAENPYNIKKRKVVVRGIFGGEQDHGHLSQPSAGGPVFSQMPGPPSGMRWAGSAAAAASAAAGAAAAAAAAQVGQNPNSLTNDILMQHHREVWKGEEEETTFEDAGDGDKDNNGSSSDDLSLKIGGSDGSVTSLKSIN